MVGLMDLTNDDIYWYCDDCKEIVEVGFRCKICGQTEKDYLDKIEAHNRRKLKDVS